ncbi:hypothetical protein [Micromonospora rubida]
MGTGGGSALATGWLIAQEIVEDLQAALREFAAIAEALGASGSRVDTD